MVKYDTIGWINMRSKADEMASVMQRTAQKGKPGKNKKLDPHETDIDFYLLQTSKSRDTKIRKKLNIRP